MHLKTKASEIGQLGPVFRGIFIQAPFLSVAWSFRCRIKFSFLRPDASHVCLPSVHFHCKLLLTQCCSVLIRTCVSLSFIWGKGLMRMYVPLIGYMSFIILQDWQEREREREHLIFILYSFNHMALLKTSLGLNISVFKKKKCGPSRSY